MSHFLKFKESKIEKFKNLQLIRIQRQGFATLVDTKFHAEHDGINRLVQRFEKKTAPTGRARDSFKKKSHRPQSYNRGCSFLGRRVKSAHTQNFQNSLGIGNSNSKQKIKKNYQNKF